ncbi:MAG: hypothetical protein L6Q99_11675 [Planctomycetes bacterium]|nr:hypothetical protein [Planctomycetota bacterium]
MQTWIRSVCGLLALVPGATHALAAGGPELGPLDSISSGSLNLGWASRDVQMVGTRALLVVSESDQDTTDLDGDGDALDDVLVLYDVTTSTSTVLGRALAASQPVRFDGDRVWFFVDEDAQGPTDLNGDGDKSDTVLHVYTVAQASLRTAPVAILPSSLVVDGARATFLVPEAKQGNTDLNGDGDKTDDVWHLFDADTGAIDDLWFAVDGATLSLAGGYVVGAVDENDQGKQDLNGDGDTSDTVAYAFDIAQGLAHSLGYAATASVIVGDKVVLRVPETSQAGVDLNGDGDATDLVLVEVDLPSGVAQSLSLAVATAPVLVEGKLVFLVAEAGQGAGDLNGDGDVNAADKVLHVLDLASGTVVNSQLAVSTAVSPSFLGDAARFLLWVDENAQGKLDRNGDGDTADAVLAAWEASSGVARDLGIIGAYAGGEIANGNVRALVRVTENLQGGIDFNLDGDVFDDVLFAVDAATATATNLGVATDPEGEADVALDRAAFVVDEIAHGVDVNVDGDLWDDVLVIAPFGSGSLGGATAAVTALAFEGNYVVALVDETSEAVDLNGDTDQADAVAHVFFGGTPPTIYCTAKSNSAGCLPALKVSGTPFLSDPSPFWITATEVLPKKPAVFHYGFGGPDAVPFAGGTLCSKGPFGRTKVSLTGTVGYGCGGAITMNMKQYIVSGVDPRLVEGAEVCGQWYTRDPDDVAGNYVSLTDAVRFVIAP